MNYGNQTISMVQPINDRVNNGTFAETLHCLNIELDFVFINDSGTLSMLKILSPNLHPTIIY